MPFVLLYLNACVYLAPLRRWRLKDNGVTTLTFWGQVTSFGHMTIWLPGVDFLWVVDSDHASIWHCYGDMADGKGEGKGERKWRRGKGKGKEKEKGKKRKGNGKGKSMWKEDSLRNVGRTNARTHRWFYTLSNAMHCIGQKIRVKNNNACNENFVLHLGRVKLLDAFLQRFQQRWVTQRAPANNIFSRWVVLLIRINANNILSEPNHNVSMLVAMVQFTTLCSWQH